MKEMSQLHNKQLHKVKLKVKKSSLTSIKNLRLTRFFLNIFASFLSLSHYSSLILFYFIA